MNTTKPKKHQLYFCHEHNQKKRCPCCGFLNTKKKGFTSGEILTSRGWIKRRLQRFFCHKCKTSFTSNGLNKRKKISDQIKRKAVDDYVLTKNSLSEVAARFGISKTAILSWLNSISEHYPLIENIRESDIWSGIVLLDGKETKVKGERRSILIASDAVNKKPIIYAKYNYENIFNSRNFLLKLKQVYPVEITGIISDFGKGKCFVGVVEQLFPSIPHQVCLVHFLRYIWMFLPRTRKSKFFWRNNVLRWIIKKVVTAKNKDESLYWFCKFKSWTPFFRASYHKRYIRSLIVNYDWLTRHYYYNYLPTNTNVIENTNRQLERKLKNMDCFKSDNNLDAFLRIWFADYRMKGASNRPN